MEKGAGEMKNRCKIYFKPYMPKITIGGKVGGALTNAPGNQDELLIWRSWQRYKHIFPQYSSFRKLWGNLK
jgi:hypothetical protein